MDFGLPESFATAFATLVGAFVIWLKRKGNGGVSPEDIDNLKENYDKLYKTVNNLDAKLDKLSEEISFMKGFLSKK